MNGAVRCIFDVPGLLYDASPTELNSSREGDRDGRDGR